MAETSLQLALPSEEANNTGRGSTHDQQLYEAFLRMLPVGKENVPVGKLEELLRAGGIHEILIEQTMEAVVESDGDGLTFADFCKLKEVVNKSVEQFVLGQLSSKEWRTLTNTLQTIYEVVEKNRIGETTKASSFAKLNVMGEDKDEFIVALCTIHGQFWGQGDVNKYMTLSNVAKVINLAQAIELNGQDYVQKHVGKNPSGEDADAMSLNQDGLPHNPICTAGALVVTTLLRAEMSAAARFDALVKTWSSLTATRNVDFNNYGYLTILRDADVHQAISWLLQSAGVFPDHVQTADDVQRALEFFLQTLSVSTTMTDVAVIGATLANSGRNPFTGKRVFSPGTVQAVLSQLFSCGVGASSGDWAYKVGLPSVTCPDGLILTIIPGLGGVVVFSPRLKNGLSVRGIEFLERLSEARSLHVFDTTKQSSRKGERTYETEALMTYAAATGSID
eukprot:CAMPEP_0119130070 /NCGR_PEP_ID=MMETSP1310-20130426/7553_1 /TAXON_ID=464262 /ORGANISM="Genus nov. species nov., Strain RCC2339" /LENGTH=449 /DNA_ID=CAMNT_0007120543 /DNA_START=78 /DNA_END=1424 /DNA_ORIENTATION=+